MSLVLKISPLRDIEPLKPEQISFSIGAAILMTDNWTINFSLPVIEIRSNLYVELNTENGLRSNIIII